MSEPYKNIILKDSFIFDTEERYNRYSKVTCEPRIIYNGKVPDVIFEFSENVCLTHRGFTLLTSQVERLLNHADSKTFFTFKDEMKPIIEDLFRYGWVFFEDEVERADLVMSGVASIDLRTGDVFDTKHLPT